MSTPTATLLVLLVGFATYVMRAGLILVLADRTLPPPVTRALRNVGPAVLAALVVTLVANPDEANRGITLPELIGLLAAAPVAFATKKLIPTLVAGMVAYWITAAVT